jgi:hypothetical protein
MSEKGNPRLSFYGLNVTVFPNTRRGGWTVSVAANGATPTYSDHATEAQARASAEQTFLKLKSSGEFKAPSPPSVRDVLEDVRERGHIPLELDYLFVELSARLEREAERADLFHLDLSDDGLGDRYWVPHSQGAVFADDGDRCRLIVTRWWLDRAEPAR